MSTIIIKSNPEFKKERPHYGKILNISEFFFDTIQGENFVGYPATFLRLSQCSLNCNWCDTQEVWRFGNPYSLDELFDYMKQYDLIRRFKEGQHLVLTGGSPLLQQEALIYFFQEFQMLYHFVPYIEIENECVIMPKHPMITAVSCWNNSPKLSSSGNSKERRYRPEILRRLSQLNNSWFKFVIADLGKDWREIDEDFIQPGLIRKSQVVLMPQGATREELIANRQEVVDLDIEKNVRYSTREHLILWDKRTGV